VTTPTWPGRRRIAHRGAGKLAPENTLAAMREGVARGYRAVEFDVMLTSDDVPILMHDPDFGRTIAGRGSVATTTYADLAKRDAGSWFGANHVGEPVPRYEDVVHFCRGHDVFMNVEIKPAAGFEEKTGRIVGELTAALFADQSGRAGWPLFSSFSVAALEAARAAAPHVPRGVLFDRVPRDGIEVARALGCISVHADHRRLDRVAIERLHDAGFAVLAYTVNDVERVQALVDAGIDAIVTDRLDLIAPD
jgi:glycerophosphoryl diester phosphodiesterase